MAGARVLGICIAILIGVLLFGAPAAGRADTVALVEALRSRDCPHPLGGEHSLSVSAELDKTAMALLQGGQLGDALAYEHVRATRSVVIRMRGDFDSASLQRVLRRQHCGSIADPEFTAIGVARDAREIAIVLAALARVPVPEDAGAIAGDVLRLVNEARTVPRRCGNRRFDAAPPLIFDDRLRIAAAVQADDMAAHGTLSHAGADGSRPADRVTRAGYAWRAVAENVAAGQVSAEAVVAGWLSSAGHCSNIMDADFTHMGVAFATSRKPGPGIYWAQVLGGRRL